MGVHSPAEARTIIRLTTAYWMVGISETYGNHAVIQSLESATRMLEGMGLEDGSPDPVDTVIELGPDADIDVDTEDVITMDHDAYPAPEGGQTIRNGTLDGRIAR